MSFLYWSLGTAAVAYLMGRLWLRVRVRDALGGALFAACALAIVSTIGGGP